MAIPFADIPERADEELASEASLPRAVRLADLVGQADAELQQREPVRPSPEYAAKMQLRRELAEARRKVEKGERTTLREYRDYLTTERTQGPVASERANDQYWLRRLRQIENQRRLEERARQLPDAFVEAEAERYGLDPDEARLVLAREQLGGVMEEPDYNPAISAAVGAQNAIASRIPGLDPIEDGFYGGAGYAAGKFAGDVAFDVGAPIAASLAAPATAGASLAGLVGLYSVAQTENALEAGDDVMSALGKGVLTGAAEAFGGASAAMYMNKVNRRIAAELGRAMMSRNYARAAQVASGAGIGGAEEFSEAIFETIGENMIDAAAGRQSPGEAVAKIGQTVGPRALYGAAMGAVGGAGMGGVNAIVQNADIKEASRDRNLDAEALDAMRPPRLVEPEFAARTTELTTAPTPEIAAREPERASSVDPAVLSEDKLEAVRSWARANPERARRAGLLSDPSRREFRELGVPGKLNAAERAAAAAEAGRVVGTDAAPLSEPTEADLPEAQPAPAPLSYEDAKKKARKLGLPTTGKASVLRERIERAENPRGPSIQNETLSKRDIERRLVDITDEMGFAQNAGPGLVDDVGAFEGPGGGVDFNFKGPIPAEIREGVQGLPANVRMMFRGNQPRGMGADWLGALGADRMIELAKQASTGGATGRREYLDTIRDQHPDADWVAFVTDRLAEKAEGGRKSTAVVYDPGSLPTGTTLEIEGAEFVVQRDDRGSPWLDGPDGTINLDLVNAIPVDPGTVNMEAQRQIEAQEDDGFDPMLEAILHREPTRGSPQNRPRYGLFGQTEFDPATGKQQELEMFTESPADQALREAQGPAIPDDPNQITIDQIPPDAEIPAQEDLIEEADDRDAPEPGMLFDILSDNKNAIDLNMGDAPGRAPSVDRIRESASRIFDVPIRHGGRRFSKGELGIYNIQEDMIRADGRQEWEIATIIHEVAHAADFPRKIVGNKTQKQWVASGGSKEAYQELKALDYDVRYGNRSPRDGRAFEGFAEYLRMTMTRPGEAESAAPKFHEEFVNRILKEQPEFKRQLAALSEIMDDYRGAGVDARVAAQIGRAGEVARGTTGSPYRDAKEFLQREAQRLHAAVANQGEVFERFMQDAVKNGYDGPSKRLYQKWLATLKKAGHYANAALVSDHIRSMRNYRRIGESLAVRLQRHGITLKNRDRFEQYVIARHAEEAWAKGINPGLTQQDAKAFREKYHTPEFEAAAKELTEFNNDLLRMLADAGVMTQREADTYIERWETYAPLLRLVEGAMYGRGSRGANVGPAVMARRGSNRRILSPIEATVQRANRFYALAIKQQLLNETMEIAEGTGRMGRWVSKIDPRIRKIDLSTEDIRGQLRGGLIQVLEFEGYDPKQARTEADKRIKDIFETMDPEGEGWPLTVFIPDFSPRSNEVRIVRDGTPELYEFDPTLYKAFEPVRTIFDGHDIGADIARFVLLMPAKALRTGAVGINPDFALANIVRDYQTAMMQSEQRTLSPKMWLGPLNSMVDLAATYFSGGRNNDPMAQLFFDLGGSMNTLASQSIKSTRATGAEVLLKPSPGRRLRAIYASRRGAGKLLGPAEAAMDSVQQAVSFSDLLPRYAEFKSVLEKNGYDRKKLMEGEQPPAHVIEEAMTAAAEVTIPFVRAGGSSSVATLSQIVPFMNASIQGTTNMARAAWSNPATRYRALMMALGQALYYYANKDEDWYKEQDDWLRYGFWTIADDSGTPIARIPRSLDWGWFVASTTEQALAAWEQEDPESFAHFGAALFQRTRPGFVPHAAVIVIEQVANKDFFRNQPIESQSMQSLPPHMRTRSTTSWVARELGEAFGLSPVRIDHAIRGMSGGVLHKGGNWLGSLQASLRGEDVPASDLPGVAPFSYRKDYGKSVGAFFDRRNEVGMEYAGERHRYLKENPDAKTNEILEAINQDTRRENYRMTAYDRLLRDLRRVRNDTTDHERVRVIERVIIGTSRQALREEPLERYDAASASDEQFAKDAIDGWIGSLFEVATLENNPNADAAIQVIRELGMDQDRLSMHLRRHLADRFKSWDTRRERSARFWSRYNAD